MQSLLPTFRIYRHVSSFIKFAHRTTRANYSHQYELEYQVKHG
ncbi:hypothetical protein VS86_01589 [Vibrio cholerae]|nr:hypothetical protein VS86_01589 [Vibrio cholerae]